MFYFLLAALAILMIEDEFMQLFPKPCSELPVGQDGCKCMRMYQKEVFAKKKEKVCLCLT